MEGDNKGLSSISIVQGISLIKHSLKTELLGVVSWKGQKRNRINHGLIVETASMTGATNGYVAMQLGEGMQLGAGMQL